MIKKNQISRLLIATVMILSSMLTVAGGMLSSVVVAEDQGIRNAIAVSPMNSRIVLIPGESYSDSITVSNPANSTHDLKFSVHVGSYEKTNDANNEGDAWTADTGNMQSYNEIVNWITLNTTSGEVAPNDSVQVSYTINVPENAPAGGQYATIVVSNETEPEQDKGTVMIMEKAQVASIIYAEVTGETKNEGKIVDNNIPTFLLTGPLKATSIVENTGNVHADASYMLQVWPLFSDEEICTNEEKPVASQVMPQSKQLHTESCDLGTMGIFKAKQTVSIFGDTSIVERIVILCPMWVIIVIFIAVVFIVGFFVFRAQKRKEQNRKR